MNLKELTIEGYKSIGKITISNPNPFTVFVGANASGKSNIFEAIELLALCNIMTPASALNLFGNYGDLINRITFNSDSKIIVDINLGGFNTNVLLFAQPNTIEAIENGKFGIASGDNLLRLESVDNKITGAYFRRNADYLHFFNFTRLFVNYPSRLTRNDDSRLNTDASNLEKVLKRILKDENKREEIFEILQLLIPGFERVEIVSSELSGTDTLIVYETALKKPLTKELISDGTFNILAIIAALYQSDTPQFLCIEEPENGLNPFVVKELVNIIRDICEEKGHYVWLNTHSQSLVSVLTKEEIIIVDKKNGLTEIKQIQDMDLHGLRMDDALYTNSIGGGNPW